MKRAILCYLLPMTEPIQVFKNEFSNRQSIHLNNAGIALLPKCVVEKVSATLLEHQTLGSLMDQAWLLELQRARKSIANCFGADDTALAFTQNCASALSQVAFGFPLTPRDRVVTLDQEYASNFYPWRDACARTGAALQVFPSETDHQIHMEKLLGFIQPGVKIVAVSWIQFLTGTLMDLKTLGEHCHRIGAYLIVDGIQGMGQLPISFRDLPIDFLAGGSHKWLCSVNGLGYFFIKNELKEKLLPLAVGAGSYQRFGQTADPALPLTTSARRFEPGGIGFLPVFGLHAASTLFQQVGIQNIADEISRLSKLFREGLNALPFVKLITPLAQAGGTTSFILDSETETRFLALCKENKVALSKRGNYLRVSIHAFNTDEEILKVLSLLLTAGSFNKTAEAIKTPFII